MKSQSIKFASMMLAVLTLIGVSACRNTAHGVVHDTKRNAGKVGQGVENVGEKIQDSTR